MLYSILIYGQEGMLEHLTQEEEEKLLAQHRTLQADLTQKKQLGDAIRLMNTSTAVTLRTQGDVAEITDGPFAETKEQLLGLYVVECDTIEEAIEAAKKLPQGLGCLEIRPITYSYLSAQK